MLLSLGISYDGLQELIGDLIAEGAQLPLMIELHPFDAEDLKQDIILNCPERSDDAERAEIAKNTIAVINGCVVTANADVPRGSAWVSGRGSSERIH